MLCCRAGVSGPLAGLSGTLWVVLTASPWKTQSETTVPVAGQSPALGQMSPCAYLVATKVTWDTNWFDCGWHLLLQAHYSVQNDNGSFHIFKMDFFLYRSYLNGWSLTFLWLAMDCAPTWDPVLHHHHCGLVAAAVGSLTVILSAKVGLTVALVKATCARNPKTAKPVDHSLNQWAGAEGLLSFFRRTSYWSPCGFLHSLSIVISGFMGSLSGGKVSSGRDQHYQYSP